MLLTCVLNTWIEVHTYHGCPGTAHTDGTTVPRMFPMEVWAFHIPKNSHLFFFPNQFPITATTPGQPVDWYKIIINVCMHVCRENDAVHPPSPKILTHFPLVPGEFYKPEFLVLLCRLPTIIININDWIHLPPKSNMIKWKLQPSNYTYFKDSHKYLYYYEICYMVNFSIVSHTQQTNKYSTPCRNAATEMSMFCIIVLLAHQTCQKSKSTWY